VLDFWEKTERGSEGGGKGGWKHDYKSENVPKLGREIVKTAGGGGF